jgi:hypothetical protein
MSWIVAGSAVGVLFLKRQLPAFAVCESDGCGLCCCKLCSTAGTVVYVAGVAAAAALHLLHCLCVPVLHQCGLPLLTLVSPAASEPTEAMIISGTCCKWVLPHGSTCKRMVYQKCRLLDQCASAACDGEGYVFGEGLSSPCVCLQYVLCQVSLALQALRDIRPCSSSG